MRAALPERRRLLSHRSRWPGRLVQPIRPPEIRTPHSSSSTHSPPGPPSPINPIGRISPIGPIRPIPPRLHRLRPHLSPPSKIIHPHRSHRPGLPLPTLGIQPHQMKIALFKAHDGDPLSAAIKSVTQSPYCHAAVLIDPDSPYRKVLLSAQGLQETGDHLLWELYWPQCRVRFATDQELENIDLFQVLYWNAENELAAMRHACQVLRDGVKYTIPDLFKQLPLFRAILGASDESTATQHMFCSWAVFDLLVAAGRRVLKINGCQCVPGMLAWPNEIEKV